jgi:hypothetical protein
MHNPGDICVCGITQRPNKSWHVFHSNLFLRFVQNIQLSVAWYWYRHPVPDHWAPIIAGYRSSIPHTGYPLRGIAGHQTLRFITVTFNPFFICVRSCTRLPEAQRRTFPVAPLSIQILLNASGNTACSLPQGLKFPRPTPRIFRVKANDIYIIRGIGNLKIC